MGPTLSRSCLQLILVALAAAPLAGCGMTKNLDDMHSSTAEMATTTKQMNDKMDALTAMNQRMETMNSNMNKMLTSMDKMANGMDAMQQTMTGMATLMGQMTEMNQSMTTMRDEMGTMITTLTTMNKTMSVMPEMNQSIGHMNDVMGHLNDMMASLDKKMDALPTMNKTMNGMSGQMASMKTQLAGLRGDLKTLNQMNGTLNDMKTGVDQLGGKMNHLDTMATSGIVDAKHGIAENLRRDELTKLENADTLPSKFPHAAAFLVAYDYQFVLQGTQEVNQADEDAFRKDAVADFLFHANGYTDSGKSITLLGPDNNQKNLQVLAGALERVDSNTIAHLKQLKRDPNQFLSMWGMLGHALDRKSEIERGSVATGWEHEVLINEPEAVYVIQLRENILGAVGLQNLSTLPQNPKSILERAKQFGLGLRYQVTGWTANTLDSNVDQLKDTYNTLVRANEAKSFLQAHGYGTRIDSNVLGALKKCEITMGATGSSPDREAVLAKIRDQIAAFVR